MLTTSNPPTTVSVPVATTGAEGKTKVDNNMTGNPVAITTHSMGIPSGVAELDSSGMVPVEELPLDIAYIDTGNTFNQTQTIDDDSGNITLINPGNIYSNDLLGNNVYMYPYYLSMENLLTGVWELEPKIGFSYLLSFTESASLDFITDLHHQHLSIGVTNTGSQISGQAEIQENSHTYDIYGDAASNIKLSLDGYIHFQVAPSGIAFDPITWTDALIINNDATIEMYTIFTIDNGSGDTIILDPSNFIDFSDATNTSRISPNGGLEVSFPTDSAAGYTYNGMDAHSTDANGAAHVNLENLTTLVNSWLETSGTAVEWTQNATLSGTDTWVYIVNGLATAIRQQQDGSIHLQRAVSGLVSGPISWIDTLVINANGTIDLANTPTTTTAPAAGMADPLPVLPTEYATIEVNGTPRQIAVY